MKRILRGALLLVASLALHPAIAQTGEKSFLCVAKDAGGEYLSGGEGGGGFLVFAASATDAQKKAMPLATAQFGDKVRSVLCVDLAGSAGDSHI